MRQVPIGPGASMMVVPRRPLRPAGTKVVGEASCSGLSRTRSSAWVSARITGRGSGRSGPPEQRWLPRVVA